MKIQAVELERVIKKIFNQLKDLNISEINVDEDFYWNIDKEERYNPYQKPARLDLGQVEGDWNELKKINEGDLDVLGGSFVCASNLLRLVGEKFVEGI